MENPPQYVSFNYGRQDYHKICDANIITIDGGSFAKQYMQFKEKILYPSRFSKVTGNSTIFNFR